MVQSLFLLAVKLSPYLRELTMLSSLKILRKGSTTQVGNGTLRTSLFGGASSLSSSLVIFLSEVFIGLEL